MTARDNTLFTTPRASHFDLLMSDGETSDASNSEEVRKQAEVIPEAFEVNENSHSEVCGSSHSEVNGNDEWSCASRKTHRKSSTGKHLNASRQHTAGTKKINPLTVEQLSSESTMEIYDFPAAWRTSDIRKFMQPFDGHYKLKWQSDTSCWIHFDDAEFCSRALKELYSDIASLRPFSLENVVPQAPKPEGFLRPSVETTLEIFGFPASWSSAELNDLLSAFAGQYRLKWRNDASCYVIFESHELLESASNELSKVATVKTRPYFGDVHLSPKKQ